MKYLTLLLLLPVTFAANGQTGIVGTVQMSDNTSRSLIVYDILEWGIKIEQLDQLGVPYVPLMDLPTALIDSAKVGKIQAYDLGLYFKSDGFGYKVSSKSLKGADIDNLIHMKNGTFIAEPSEIFLIGLDTEDSKAKYFHIFIRERDDYQSLIQNSTQFSDKVISFRFDDLQFLYFR